MSHEVCHIRCQTTSESCCHNINITQKLLEQMSEYIAKIISDDMWHELCHSKCQTIWLCWCQVFVWTLKELEISICICTHHISKNMSELSGSFAALWSVWFFSCGCCGDHEVLRDLLITFGPCHHPSPVMSWRAKAQSQTTPVRHSIGFAYAVQKAMDMGNMGSRFNHQIWNQWFSQMDIQNKPNGQQHFTIVYHPSILLSI